MRYETKKVETALLVGLHMKSDPIEEAYESLDELKLLAFTAGVEVCGQMMVSRRSLDPQYLFGSGKLEEILEKAKGLGVNIILIDQSLNPMQGKKLNDYFQLKVLDRVEIILDIFSFRAKTNEAKIQVELAQLQYLLPRLKRMWLHLSRQDGGIGTRGPGETQLEIDRRRIREKVTRLQSRLKEVRRIREVQRKERKRSEIIRISLVGYTNAGKSSLFQLLSQNSTLIEDKLFCTLDPLARFIEISDQLKVILVDTVGFIRKLPHFLVEAFRSTLEEVFEADLLLHVIDGNSKDYREKSSAVYTVLNELGLKQPEMIHVINKVDLIDNEKVQLLEKDFIGAKFISVKDNKGIDDLLNSLSQYVRSKYLVLNYIFPHSKMTKVNQLHKNSKIILQEFKEDGVHIKAEIDPSLRSQFCEYEQKK